MEIDLGTKAIREGFSLDDQEGLVGNLIRTFSTKINSVFQGVEIKGF